MEETQGMRKEVKRSLLLWPIAASATITAMSWLSTVVPTQPLPASPMAGRLDRTIQQDAEVLSPSDFGATRYGSTTTAIELADRILRREVGLGESSLIASSASSSSASSSSLATSSDFDCSQDVDCLRALVDLMPGDLTPSDRSEFGTEAARIPDRVAGVLSGPVSGGPVSITKADRAVGTTLRAPVLDSQRELAGLSGLGSKLAAREVRSSATPKMSATDVLEYLFQFSGNTNSRNRQIVAPEPTRNYVTLGQPQGKTSIAADLLMGARILQDLRNRDRAGTTGLNVSVSDGVGSDADLLAESILNGPVLSLPESNRVLAKPVTTSSSDVRPQIEKSVRKSGPVAETMPGPDGSMRVTDIPMPYQESAPESAKPRTSAWPAGWPTATRLNDQLEVLRQVTGDAAVMSWAQDVSDRLAELKQLPRLGDPAAGDLIEALAKLADEGEAAAEAMTGDADARETQVAFLRAVHAIHRRTAVWQPIWSITQSAGQTWMSTDQTPGTMAMPARQAVIDAIEVVRDELVETGDQPGWTAYLLLDEITDAADGRVLGTAIREERSIIAQRLLSRLSWHALQEEHLSWLDRDSVKRLAELIRPWARGAVDYADLISQIERQESDAIDLAAIDIADAVQTLRFAKNPEAVAIADSLGTYYRNANVRMAISDDMLNRMLPTIAPKAVPVNTTMLGSRVRGTSVIDSDLSIALTPSPDRWSIGLRTLGNVQTRSTGFNGPVAVRTSGTSRFVANKPIIVSPDGVTVGDVDVRANGQTRLHGIRTDYDKWPLVGSLVRSIAESRFESMVPKTTRIANRKIETEVRSEIDTQVDDQVSTATDQLSDMVLGPLAKLRLDPQVIDMSTTGDRLLARYRVAGDWQLAAFTPRPRAPQSSLMSVQVHQSAINNTLEQLVPRDRPMAIEDVLTRAAGVFGQEVVIPDDMPEGVTIQFARTRPVTVEIEDGLFWVTMRIVRLSRGENLDLTQFIVRAAYKPEINGLDAKLVRDGHLRISGPGMSMRERLPVRAIFNKVLSTSNKLPLTLPQLVDHPSMQGLAVNQLELRGGWMGLAVGENSRQFQVASGQENRR